MKDIETIKKDIEKVVDRLLWGKSWERLENVMISKGGSFIRAEGVRYDEKEEFIEQITKIFESKLNEIREEAVRGFVEWYEHNYPDGVWRSKEVILNEYLTTKEGEK